MKYVSQKAYPDWLYVTMTEMDEAHREQGKTTTVASSACGLCAAVMVADRLLVHSNFELKDALKLSYETNANYREGTSYRRFTPAFAEKMGFDWEATSDPQRLVYCLQTGGAAVVNVGGDREGYNGLFSRGGHYIVAISQERDGRIAILDPGYFEGRYEKGGGDQLLTFKDGVIALCDLQVLAQDAANRDPCYYLFWRK